MQKVLRPLTFRGLFDEAFSLLKGNGKLFYGLSALVYVPGMMMLRAFSTEPTRKDDLILASVLSIAGLLWVLVGAFVIQGALTVAVSRRYLGQDVTIGEAIGAVTSRLLSYIGTGLLSTMFVVIGLICLVIPGIYAGFVLTFVTEVFVIEGLSGMNALRRSKQLAKGEFNNVFSVNFVTGVASSLMSLATGAIAAFCMGAIPGAIGGAAYGLIDGLASSLVLAITQTVLVVLYFDIRVRKEGFDIQLLANAIDGSAGPAFDQAGVVTVPAAPQVGTTPGASEDIRP